MTVDRFDKLGVTELLQAYVSSHDDDEAEAVLSGLFEKHASNQIKAYFQKRVSTSADLSNYRFTRADAEDLASKAALDLISALRRRRELPICDRIENLGAYISTICHAVFSDFWRRRFAEYHKLKNRIRYLLLRRQSAFISRRDEKRKLICSLADSPSHRTMFAAAEIIEKVKDADPDYPIDDESALVHEALVQARGWLYLADLVEIVAALRGIKDIPPNETIESDDYLARHTGDSGDADAHRNHLFDLRFLWSEIRGLPRFQRIALIYNLRDEDGKELNCVWWESGIATLEEIGEIFELKKEKMAELLTRLPFSDSAIARVLGIEDVTAGERTVLKETKVANLRKVAREYLDRRMQGKQKRGR